MQQNINFDLIQINLQKSMLISVVKIKLKEAKLLMIKAENRLEQAIKNGNGEQIYDCAYETAQRKDRFNNLRTLYMQIKEGEF